MKQILTSHDIVAILCQIKDRESIWSSQNPENIRAIVDVVSQLPMGSVCVEIGTRRGFSAIAALLANKYITITSIDTDKSAEHMCINSISELLLNKSISHFYRAEDWFLKERISFINDTSENVAKNWRRNVDYLFIDGNHSYDGVVNDVNLWSKFLVLGSILGFDDYGHPINDNMDVTRAVNDTILKNSLQWRILTASFPSIFFQKERP